MSRSSNDLSANGAKVLIIGPNGVGKSSLLRRFKNEPFSPNYASSDGMEHHAWKPDEKSSVVMHLYDIPGKAFSPKSVQALCCDANGIVLVYDMADRESFDQVKSVWNEIFECPTDFIELPVVVVGNKSDLTGKRQVDKSAGKTFSEQHGAEFMETSALDGTNTALVINTLLQKFEMDATDQHDTASAIVTSSTSILSVDKKTGSLPNPAPLNAPQLRKSNRLGMVFSSMRRSRKFGSRRKRSSTDSAITKSEHVGSETTSVASYDSVTKRLSGDSVFYTELSTGNGATYPRGRKKSTKYLLCIDTLNPESKHSWWTDDGLEFLQQSAPSESAEFQPGNGLTITVNKELTKLFGQLEDFKQYTVRRCSMPSFYNVMVTLFDPLLCRAVHLVMDVNTGSVRQCYGGMFNPQEKPAKGTLQRIFMSPSMESALCYHKGKKEVWVHNNPANSELETCLYKRYQYQSLRGNEIKFVEWLTAKTFVVVYRTAVWMSNVVKDRTWLTWSIGLDQQLYDLPVIRYFRDVRCHWIIVVSADMSSKPPIKKGKLQIYYTANGKSHVIDGCNAVITYYSRNSLEKDEPLLVYTKRTVSPEGDLALTLNSICLNKNDPVEYKSTFWGSVVIRGMDDVPEQSFPVILEVDPSTAVIYLVTQSGTLNIHDLNTGHCIYQLRVSRSTIITSSFDTTKCMLRFVSEKGKVFSCHIDKNRFMKSALQISTDRNVATMGVWKFTHPEAVPHVDPGLPVLPTSLANDSDVTYLGEQLSTLSADDCETILLNIMETNQEHVDTSTKVVSLINDRFANDNFSIPNLKKVVAILEQHGLWKEIVDLLNMLAFRDVASDAIIQTTFVKACLESNNLEKVTVFLVAGHVADPSDLATYLLDKNMKQCVASVSALCNRYRCVEFLVRHSYSQSGSELLSYLVSTVDSNETRAAIDSIIRHLNQHQCKPAQLLGVLRLLDYETDRMNRDRHKRKCSCQSLETSFLQPMRKLLLDDDTHGATITTLALVSWAKQYGFVEVKLFLTSPEKCSNYELAKMCEPIDPELSLLLLEYGSPEECHKDYIQRVRAQEDRRRLMHYLISRRDTIVWKTALDLDGMENLLLEACCFIEDPAALHNEITAFLSAAGEAFHESSHYLPTVETFLALSLLDEHRCDLETQIMEHVIKHRKDALSSYLEKLDAFAAESIIELLRMENHFEEALVVGLRRQLPQIAVSILLDDLQDIHRAVRELDDVVSPEVWNRIGNYQFARDMWYEAVISFHKSGNIEHWPTLYRKLCNMDPPLEKHQWRIAAGYFRLCSIKLHYCPAGVAAGKAWKVARGYGAAHPSELEKLLDESVNWCIQCELNLHDKRTNSGDKTLEQATVVLNPCGHVMICRNCMPRYEPNPHVKDNRPRCPKCLRTVEGLVSIRVD